MTDFSKSEQQGLAKMQIAQAHPDADLLTAFAEQSLQPREREQMLAHLAVCPDCREVIGYAAPEVTVPVPHLAPKPTFWRWPMLRWGAVAASAVIVIGAATLGLHERTAKNELMVKMQSNAPVPASQAPPKQSAEQSREERASADQTPTVSPNSKEQVASPSSLSRAPTDHVISEYKPGPAVSGLKSAQIRYEKLPAEQKADLAKLEADKFSSPAPAPPPTPAQVAEKQNTNAVRDQNAFSAGAVGGPLHGNANSSYTLNARTAAVVADEKALKESSTTPGAPPASSQNEASLKRESSDFAYSQEAGAAAKKSASEVPAETRTLQTQPQASTEVVSKTASARKAKDTLQASMAAAVAAGSGVGTLARKLLQWKVSSDGSLQRSTDEGHNWQPVMADTKFRSVAVVGNEVWVGGPKGLLLHSTDDGQSWVHVTPSIGNAGITGDVMSIRFSDPSKGLVETSTGETWVTEDAGKSWKKLARE